MRWSKSIECLIHGGFIFVKRRKVIKKSVMSSQSDNNRPSEWPTPLQHNTTEDRKLFWYMCQQAVVIGLNLRHAMLETNTD